MRDLDQQLSHRRVSDQKSDSQAYRTRMMLYRSFYRNRNKLEAKPSKYALRTYRH